MQARALFPTLALALAACSAPTTQQQAPVQAPPQASAPVSSQPTQAAALQWYKDAQQAGQRVWPIDSQASLIAVTVRRGGPMARLGHDHLIASRSVEGFVAPDAGRADVQFRLDQLLVDDEVLRQQAGLTTNPSADAIEGTRNNMLNRVLDAERYPLVTLHVEGQAADAGASQRTVRLRIGLHGVERSMEVPVTLDIQSNALSVRGSLMLNQTDFGITPMSVLGGAIVVLDQMEIQFRLSATQSASNPAR